MIMEYVLKPDNEREPCMDKQINLMTLIGVHSTMHLVQPNLFSCTRNYNLTICVCKDAYTCIRSTKVL